MLLVKGGPRYLNLLLLASMIATEASVLTEASVQPAQAMQGNDKMLPTGQLNPDCPGNVLVMMPRWFLPTSLP